MDACCLYDFPPDVSDHVIADRLADYLLEGTQSPRGKWYLSIIVPRGDSVSLTCNRRRKNIWEFVTDERRAAHAWIVEAALAGHSVLCRLGGRDCMSMGMGKLSEIREHIAGSRGKQARAWLRATGASLEPIP